MKKIITAMSMAIVLTTSNTMAQEEINLGAISDFFSEMSSSIEEGVTTAKESTLEIQNIDYLHDIKVAVFGEPEVIVKIVYVDKIVEKIVYQDKIIEKIVMVQPKERSCVTKVHQLAVPAGESTTTTTCTEWK